MGDPIGRFVVSFTNLAYWTLFCIEVIASQEMRDAFVELPITSRAKIAEALMLGTNPPESIQQRIKAAFSELRRLAVQRNLVAHNAPMMNVYELENGDLRTAFELRSQRDANKQVTTAELVAFHKSAIDLGTELYSLTRQLDRAAGNADI